MAYDLNILDDGETEIVANVMGNLGLEEGDDDDHEKFVKFLETADEFDILDKYLTWIGIIGFTNEILDVIEKIREAKINTEDESSD
ncbi:hypothetical protein EVB32_049 [Rhizobium phage RHph_TM39]|uniref:Uncharacterized protein n=1 Tax=Rhizobium phage RHph_TM30 TaxID=2509764 RepID=A0A7S5R4S9_9CAUD|nr:hypothetical protein PQC16_gp049 [Rhizobium phage RHph_TM30]QIG71156.1 hypothetical protein EVB93_049 [Rhizobium phage RHph_TM30]QIG77037.1 hypothetical protein EVB32_049 [Rhizobium phage RHph_TM39]QIG77376.1 hypothetical protein EVB61_048 [Rhizobium phage RHph_TM21B]QIG77636.1 hypothetical protein EVB64_049 [Rhizobium phage RHph_TM61]